MVVDDALRAEYRVLRRGALGAPAVWSDMLWTSVEGRKVPMDRVDGGRQQPADICVCSRVLLRFVGCVPLDRLEVSAAYVCKIRQDTAYRHFLSE